jgi:hypothetical protein
VFQKSPDLFQFLEDFVFAGSVVVTVVGVVLVAGIVVEVGGAAVFCCCW